MSNTDSRFKINRGSDLTWQMNWPNSDGTNADLTGYSVLAFEPSTALAGYITATITDAATGEITVRFEWSDTFRTGQLMRFRLQISLGEEQQSTNELEVLYT